MYSNWPPTEEQRAIAREKEFKIIYEEIGGKRFEVATAEVIRKHDTGFFPTVGEFYRYVPVSTHYQEGERCPLCKDSSGFQICERQHPYDPSKTYEVALKCKHDGLNLDGRIA